MTVRTRIAPSPTGDPHVGTAYIALFNLAFARSQGGQFILRIEDTDQVRSTAAAEQQILDSLRWLGLTWDEGPDVGGDFGPYRQSERSAIYAQHSEQLLAAGHAFHCFCTPERLDGLRQEQMANRQQPGYDGHCLALTAAQVQAKRAAGEACVVRMKVPGQGVCAVQDRLRGQIDIDWAQVDMQVLMKQDGLPTYHLANVVDDHLMGITHVIRGEEWINSAPKHLLLYQYFGWQVPELVHMPLLRNPDKSKLSKRKNPTSINYYRRQGFLPQALVNYLGRMGWSMPDEAEIFALAEMIANFNIDKVRLGGPIFDLDKLRWLNGEYLRALPEDAWAAAVAEHVLHPDYLRQIIPLVQERADTLAELAPQVDYLLGNRRPLSAEDFAHKVLAAEDCLKILQFVSWSLDELDQWDRLTLHDAISGLAEASGTKVRDFLYPLFLAVSGRPVSLPLYDSMAILGRDLVRARLRDAMDVLGGVGKKVAKRLEKEYRTLV